MPALSKVVKFERKLPKLGPQDKEMRCDESLESTVRELAEVKREFRRVKIESESLAFRVKYQMGDATVLFDQSGTEMLATYRFTGEIDQFDEKAFAAAHPKLYKKFTKKVRQRRLVLK